MYLQDSVLISVVICGSVRQARMNLLQVFAPALALPR